jgi:hypothetical protein
MLTRSALPFAALAALALACACSNQGEGEICDPNAGNAGDDDCQGGLTCQSLGAGIIGFRCCPPDLTQAKTQVCNVSHPGVTQSPAPPDAGLADEDAMSVDATSDATVDARMDSPQEALPDAPAEAGIDATDALAAPAD